MLLNNNVLLFLDIVPNYDRGLREYERIEYKEIKVDDTIGNWGGIAIPPQLFFYWDM